MRRREGGRANELSQMLQHSKHTSHTIACSVSCVEFCKTGQVHAYACSCSSGVKAFRRSLLCLGVLRRRHDMNVVKPCTVGRKHRPQTRCFHAPRCFSVHQKLRHSLNTDENELTLSRREQLAFAGCLTLWQGYSCIATPSAAEAALIEENIAQSVYEACVSSVASVVNYKKDRTGTEVSLGVGTGFLWDSYGHVVTNYHCISKLDKSTDVTKVVFQIPGSSETVSLSSELIATDTMNDLAVLRIDPDQLATATSNNPAFRPLPQGSSSALKIGQSVFALGSPYGLSSTLSAGVVSGVNRSIPSPVGTRIYGVIQTDAAISAGNSGGPLLDSSGRVVGVNTATFTRAGTGRGSGVNFALPIDMVRDVVPKLIIYGNSKGRRV